MFEEMGLEHRLCVMHLYANCRKKFGGGTVIRRLMMGAAKATYKQAWEAKMSALKRIDAKCWEWLMVVPTKYWCKHAFPYYTKCDIVMNNLAESFNSTILSARDKPILTMYEWIREYLMDRFGKQRLKLQRWPHRVMPKPRERLDKEVEGSANWLATWSVDLEFQVVSIYGGRAFVVDIGKLSCSCNFWQLVGIPCRHACAAIAYRRQKPEDFVDTCYTRYSYELCYSHGISAINGQDMWPIVEVDEMLPPNYKKGPGRPKKLRRRDPYEEQPETAKKLKRAGTTYRCTKCDKFGHNSRGCKSTEVNPAAQARKRKQTQAVARDSSNASATASNFAAASTSISASASASASASVNAPASASVNVPASVSVNATASAPTPVNAPAFVSAPPPVVAPASVSAPASLLGGSVSFSAPAAVQPVQPNQPLQPTDFIPVSMLFKSTTSVATTATQPQPRPKPKVAKRLKLPVKRQRWSTRITRHVLPYTGPGSDPNKPLMVDDDGDLTQEQVD